MTRERDVLSRVKQKVKGSSQSIAFLDTFVEYANEYVAILYPESQKWNTYHPSIRGHIARIKDLGVAQIRPLMMAVARHFAPKEAKEAFRLFVNWSVRFLVAGGGPSGTLEKVYVDAAREVTTGRITTTKQLVKEMIESIPTDVQFEAAFATATVSKNHIARYYLRALELKVKNDPEPELVPNEETVINLEHVLPETPGRGWKHIHPDTAAAVYRRLGNMVLLQASKNNAIGNRAFDEKRPILKVSLYFLTKMVGEKAAWDVKDIDERQRLLAESAVSLWTIT